MLHLPLPYRLLQRKMEFDTVLFIRGARCVAGALRQGWDPVSSSKPLQSCPEKSGIDNGSSCAYNESVNGRELCSQSTGHTGVFSHKKHKWQETYRIFGFDSRRTSRFAMCCRRAVRSALCQLRLSYGYTL